MAQDKKTLAQKTAAGGLITGISAALVWQVYGALDTRIRKVEINESVNTVMLKTIQTDVRDIKNFLIKTPRRGHR